MKLDSALLLQQGRLEEANTLDHNTAAIFNT